MTSAELEHFLHEVHANVAEHTPSDVAIVIIVAHKHRVGEDYYVSGPPLVATNLPIETVQTLIRILSTAEAIVRPPSHPS